MRNYMLTAIRACVPGVLVLTWAVSPVHAQSETITATASIKNPAGVQASAPVTVVVDRLSTNAERDQVTAALKQKGTTGVRDLLMTWNPIGSLRVGQTNTAIKYAYARTTASGRLVTVVTGSPIAFIGAGLPGAQSKTGFDLGLALLDMPSSGAGQGELLAATKVKLNEQGAVVTDDYSGESVRLSNVVKK